MPPATGKTEESTIQRRSVSSKGKDSPAEAAAGAPSGQLLKRMPTAVPPFTVADIRKAIPAHCFQRSLVKSFGYLAVDCVVVAILFFLSRFIDTTFTDESFGSTGGFLLRHAVWTAYWCVQGSVMTGLWVIGHECGHGGFADSELLNDSVGLVVHSLLLVPFFSWKISHRRHHSNTANLDTDEVFVPEIKEFPGSKPPTATAAHAAADENEDAHEHGSESQSILFMAQSLYRTVYLCVRIFLMLTVGWPLYLLMNATGHPNYPKNVVVNHFSPSSPIFTNERERKQVFISDVALAVVVLGFVYLANTYGFVWFFKTYGIPYLITNAFLVLITFLQHTDPALPHYSGDEWDWLRGALATVDRDYGILNYFHHHISDTHVVHHLFSSMPHYNAEEATRAIIPLLGNYYRSDRTPIWNSLWRNFARCTYVSPDQVNPEKGVYWFQKGQYA